MSWTTPKTDWVNGDYFEVGTDYTRIKGNIEFLATELAKYNPNIHITTMSSFTIYGYPTETFFNRIVDNTKEIKKYTWTQHFTAMPSYSANAPAWSAEELNAIEDNHLQLYNTITGTLAAIKRIEFTLGGKQF